MLYLYNFVTHQQDQINCPLDQLTMTKIREYIPQEDDFQNAVAFLNTENTVEELLLQVLSAAAHGAMRLLTEVETNYNLVEKN